MKRLLIGALLAAAFAFGCHSDLVHAQSNYGWTGSVCPQNYSLSLSVYMYNTQTYAGVGASGTLYAAGIDWGAYAWRYQSWFAYCAPTYQVCYGTATTYTAPQLSWQNYQITSVSGGVVGVQAWWCNPPLPTYYASSTHDSGYKAALAKAGGDASKVGGAQLTQHPAPSNIAPPKPVPAH